MDDALAGETRPLEQGAAGESRVREDLEKEDAPAAAPFEAVDARREISRHLRPSAFPASRDDLVAEAEGQNAPELVVTLLQKLPSGDKFATAHEVWAALEGYGDVREAAAHEPLSEADR